MKKLLIAGLLGVLYSGVALADYVESSALCPYSCKSAGYSKSVCKDRKDGDKCYVSVERGSVKAGDKAAVWSRQCPLSCKDVFGSKKDCKDWKEGNTCYVQSVG